MLHFKLVYSDEYFLPIGQHVFASQKFRQIHQLLLGTGVAEPGDFIAPQSASDDDVRLAHTPAWVQKLRSATLSPREELLLEIPFSPPLVHAFYMHAGGSILAAELALRDGVCVNIGGGFHHAFPDHGEGFCMINDIAIALLRMFQEQKISRAMVLDCDVHQGNGTAAIFNPQAATAPPAESWSAPMFQPPRAVSVKEAAPGDVFTISLHQENNYPAWKPASSLDINLPDGTTDAEYLSWLDNALSSAFRQFEPDLIAYVAGADPYGEDQLGGLSLTIDGLKQRDEMVFSTAQARNVPLFAVFAGGYARRVEDTVTIHTNTVVAAAEIFGKQKTEIKS
jgi:acetoin utilization deacetylase AcuC-like enzyme